jgi:hypothetical protein
MSKTVGSVVELTDGNVRNHHIYLRDMHWIPQAAIGGGNVSEAADEHLTVTFSPGQIVKTDIAGDKMIFRERGAVRDFFERVGAKGGTRVVVELTGPYSVQVSKLR